MGENKTDSPETLCISVAAAGRLLGVSRGTAYLMAHSKQLPVIKCGQRRLVVPLAALRRMLERTNNGLHENQ